MERTVGAIVAEMEHESQHWPQVFQTVYFGGGSPSILKAQHLTLLVDALKKNFSLADDAEWCLEANPDDCKPDTLATWKDLGISRLSMGIQSFDAGLLKAMNRAHDSAQAQDALQLAREAGFEHFSADLIYGQPGQDLALLKRDLELLIAQKPQHISAYLLTVESGTALHHQVKTGKTFIPEDGIAEGHFNLICAALRAAGYEHYEVSNWALPGHRSRHNSAYWKGQPYLGLGPSAHGFTGEQRYWNVAHNPNYIKALDAGELPRTFETLTERDRVNELLMTGLRTAEGVSFEALTALGVNTERDIVPALKPWLDTGSAVLSEMGFHLSEAGLLWADRVASDLFILEA